MTFFIILVNPQAFALLAQASPCLDSPTLLLGVAPDKGAGGGGCEPKEDCGRDGEAGWA